MKVISRTNGAKPMPRHVWVTPRWTRGDAQGYRVDAPLARNNLRTKGAKPMPRHVWVTPRWTRGDAQGYRVDAPLARKILCTNGAKPHSVGQRPGIASPANNFSPERAQPNNESQPMKSEYQCVTDFEHHFPDVSKMVPAGLLEMNAKARELEAKIAENVVELLEA